MESTLKPKLRIASDRHRAMTKRVAFTGPVMDVAACPAGKDRIWIYDSKQPGLALMVTAAGAKAFYCYLKFQGRPQRIRLGGFPELTVDHARTLAKKEQVKKADGVNPMKAQKESRAKAMNLGELWEWYLKTWARPRKRSWEDDQGRYDNHLKAWASRRLTDITTQDVAALHHRVAEKTSQPTANRVLALLSTMFNKAKAGVNYEDGNPCKGVEKFAETSRERFLSADDLTRFFEALDSGVVIEHFRDFFKLALFTGARRSNVLSMRWDEIDLKAGTWSISGAKSKNKIPVVIHLADPALDVLKDRQQIDKVWVFPGRGKSEHLKWPDGAWKRLCTDAKISNARIHDLRRTLGSWQAAGNTSLAIIGKSLGHRSQQTTAIYARLQLDPVKASVNAATAAMIAASKAEKKTEID